MTALAMQDVTKRFGEIPAVDEVDLVMQAGEVRGLLGPNGAGKTTLLRLLFGLVRPDYGTVELHGRGLADPRRLEGVAGFVEEPSFYPYLSARANLAVLAELDGGSSPSVIAEALERVDLSARADERVGGYSTGMRKRLGIASALIRSPRLLVLDEPIAGLDPAGVRSVAALVRELGHAGVSVLLSSHQIVEVEDVCDSFTVLRAGRVVWSGSAEEMRVHAPAASHRLATADDTRALAIATATPRVRAAIADDGGLAIEADGDALDALVIALGRSEIPVRRLEPTVGSLEAMFFALVGQPDGSGSHATAPEHESTAVGS